MVQIRIISSIFVRSYWKIHLTICPWVTCSISIQDCNLLSSEIFWNSSFFYNYFYVSCFYRYYLYYNTTYSVFQNLFEIIKFLLSSLFLYLFWYPICFLFIPLFLAVFFSHSTCPTWFPTKFLWYLSMGSSRLQNDFAWKSFSVISAMF